MQKLVAVAFPGFPEKYLIAYMSTRLEQLQQMLLQEPHDSFLQYAICMEYMALAEFEKAAAGLQKIITDNKNYLAAYYQLGKCLEACDKTGEAKAVYQEGVSIAKKQNNNKAMNELNEALFLLEE